MILTIFGYPKTGKTLLFNLLTEQNVEISKFSSSAQEYHKSVVDVPDHRLKALADHFETPPVYAKIEYLDTGAISIGEVKNSMFIDLIRRADGLIHIVRAFEDSEIIHPKGSIDPLRDLDDMEEEMKSVDYLSIEKRLERLEVDIRKIKSKELVEEFELQKKLKDFLEEGHPLRVYPWTEREEYIVRGFKFLSQRPIIKLINTDENSFHDYSKYHGQKGDNAITLVFCGKIETELLELDQDDRQMFQQEYGLEAYEYIKENLIKKSYELMNLISFFTVGNDETKAWTLDKDSTAFIAAGKIHSDIQQGFIRGEVIEWDKFLAAGSFTKAKEQGALRLEGKEYVVSDGEIMHFRFNK